MGQPELLAAAVRDGCLLQVTAGSLTGLFGNRVQTFAETLVRRGLVRFVASDAHGPQGRASAQTACLSAGRPVDRGESGWGIVFRQIPSRVAAGGAVASGRRSVEKSGWGRVVRPKERGMIRKPGLVPGFGAAEETAKWKVIAPFPDRKKRDGDAEFSQSSRFADFSCCGPGFSHTFATNGRYHKTRRFCTPRRTRTISVTQYTGRSCSSQSGYQDLKRSTLCRGG